MTYRVKEMLVLLLGLQQFVVVAGETGANVTTLNVIAVQSVREQWTNNDLVDLKRVQMFQKSTELPPANQVCKNYYGLGVEDVWARGYSGKNVTVAILDVGVNVDLNDLKHNIDRSKSYNFVLNNRNVTPEDYDELSTSASPMTDHGNQISSIVAATKGNHICSAGIAYNATLYVRKIFNVEKYGRHFSLSPRHWTSSHIFSRAILQDFIDVSVIIMAWAPESPYDSLDQSTDLAIKETATKGRNGRGTLLFVPSGPVGNGLANNVYTITVGGMRRFGEIPVNSFADASVITSGLTEGSNLTSLKMVTTTLSNRCVTSFKGVSAATAQVAAIAALVLEANPSLSMRDVKHILVQASDFTRLKESRPKEYLSFKQNGAGHYFHGILGFGLLNAFKAVILAETWKPVPPLFSKNLTYFHKRSHSHNLEFDYQYACEFEKVCLTKVEEVEVNATLFSISEINGIEIISPNGTISVLLDPALVNQSLEQIEHQKSTDVLLSSVHFWDETAVGDWKVKIQFKHELKVPINVDSVMLTIYGTGQGTVDEELSTNIQPEVPTKDTPPKKPQKKNSGNMVAVNYLLVAVVCSLTTSVICPG